MGSLDGALKARQKQIEKLGSEEAYKAEMRRRRSLVKNYELQKNPEKAREMALRSAEVRRRGKAKTSTEIS